MSKSKLRFTSILIKIRFLFDVFYGDRKYYINVFNKLSLKFEKKIQIKKIPKAVNLLRLETFVFVYKKSGVALSQLSLTEHYRRRKFYC